MDARMWLLAPPSALETEGAMTLLTLTSVLPQMHVILRMTGDTFPVELDFGGGLLVTRCAAQLGVRAG
jgi:hypothetical protein